MAYMESSCRLGIGLALCLAWVTFGTPAQADAMSESPFTLDPPTGWQRDVIENGTVRFVDPKNQDCLVFITPHASNIGAEKGESWLRNAFDTERDTVIKDFKALGVMFLNEVDRPVLERIANRTYAIHGSFLMKAIENSEEKIARIRILLLLRRESIQRLMSVADYSACEDDVIVNFLNQAITNIIAEKQPASLHEIQKQMYWLCINHCLQKLLGPDDGQQHEACAANCRLELPHPPIK